MSKSKMNTREKILDKSLELFNERGIEYVGLREIARLLDIKVGNITYYFPTKDDLVFELSQELSKANSAIMAGERDNSLPGFMLMQQKFYENQQRFRCLLLSFVHIIQQNKQIAVSYKKIQKQRQAAFRSNLTGLINNGYLKELSEEELNLLISLLSLIGRFWISESAISMDGKSDQLQIQQYLRLVANLFTPYATARGRKDLEALKETWPG